MLKIQELRKSKNLTQRALAEQIGVKNYTVANWEQNRTEPGLEDLIDLANFFECSIDYLVGRENDFGQIILMKEFSEEYTKFWELYNGLSKEKQQMILVLMQALQR